MTDLKLRIRSIIFPSWVYSESHYKISSFFDRWESYNEDKGFDTEPEIQQLINFEWIPVIPIVTI